MIKSSIDLRGLPVQARVHPDPSPLSPRRASHVTLSQCPCRKTIRIDGYGYRLFLPLQTLLINTMSLCTVSDRPK